MSTKPWSPVTITTVSWSGPALAGASSRLTYYPAGGSQGAVYVLAVAAILGLGVIHPEYV